MIPIVLKHVLYNYLHLNWLILLSI